MKEHPPGPPGIQADEPVGPPLTHTSRVTIGFPADPRSWQHAPAQFSEHALSINGHPVMEDWETPYMETLARIACRNGGVILEVGFGMGISAGFIQQHDIARHIIIEASEAVFARHLAVPKGFARPIEPHLGFWQDVCATLPSASVDGILFDTYPLHEGEIHRNHFVFFTEAHRLLKPGGVFTYYSDEADGFSEEHARFLAEAGFTEIAGEVCPVSPPTDCLYWRHPTILAPIITKEVRS